MGKSFKFKNLWARLNLSKYSLFAAKKSSYEFAEVCFSKEALEQLKPVSPERAQYIKDITSKALAQCRVQWEKEKST